MDDARPRTRLICALTATDAEAMARDARAAAAAGADAVELRLDCLAEPPGDAALGALIDAADVETVATCRPRREGGRCDAGETDRLALLARAAAAGADWIDVELDALDRADVPRERTILSHHDFAGVPADLDALAARLDASPAAVNKLAFAAAGPEDALRALDVVAACRKPTLALAMGPAGVLSRVLAGAVGAFGTFAALAPGAESAPGQPTLADFLGLYRWRDVGPGTALFGVIACPVGHSMSPAIHNAAFAAAGVDGVYLPLLVQPGAEAFRCFLDACRSRAHLPWRGFSVTIPHKVNALEYVGPHACHPLARQIAAVNTVTLEPDGSLAGDNTDYAAALDALCHAMDIQRPRLAGRDVAVIGAGGVARAVVAGLAHENAAVTVYNRTAERAERLADEFACRWAGLDGLADLTAEIVVNCTSVGMHPREDASPLPALPASVKVVFDTIYNPVETRLLAAARRAGCTCVSGVDMFVNQAVAQFERWTATPAPREVMRRVVLAALARR